MIGQNTYAGGGGPRTGWYQTVNILQSIQHDYFKTLRLKRIVLDIISTYHSNKPNYNRFEALELILIRW